MELTPHNSASDSLRNNFQIVRLAEGDVRARTDNLRQFESLVFANENDYPEIRRWYSQRVLPGIRNAERVAFIGYLNELPVVSAVVRKGNDAKFCHLKIDENLRDMNLGEIFFSLMALELRDLAKTVHFTLPQSLWEAKGDFFRSFGFRSASVADTQYRLFNQELACSCSFAEVWQAVITKIPKLSDLYSFGGFSMDRQILMSIRPQFAEKILKKRKTVEIRRRFSTRWLGYSVNLYATAPLMSLVGEARISSIIEGSPDNIWNKYGNQLGCTREEFDRYCAGCKEVYAIELDNVRSYRSFISLAQIAYLTKEALIPPQSYLTLEKNKTWAKAISLVSYMHACFKSTIGLTINAKDRPMLAKGESVLEPGVIHRQSELLL